MHIVENGIIEASRQVKTLKRQKNQRKVSSKIGVDLQSTEGMNEYETASCSGGIPP